MADPTKDTIFGTANLKRDSKAYVIKNALQLYVGQLAKLTSGYLDKHAAGANTVCLGVVVGPGVPGNNLVLDGFALGSPPVKQIAPGNTSAAAGNEPKAIVERGDQTIKDLVLTVAGTLAGTIADVGTVLYAGAGSSNLADLSTTQTSSDKPLGEIVAFKSASGGSATYDVLIYSYEARRAM